MKKIKIFLLFNLIFGLLASCGTVKEGFSMQKKDNSDEFLVEKKSPLLMPPNFNELPVPKSEKILEDDKEEIKKLITKSDNNSSNSDSSNNNSTPFEELLLGKIKNN